MLNHLVPLLNEVEVKTRWEVITGGNDFFEVTKAFHNALQGSDYKLTQQARDIFLMHNAQNRQRMQFSEDVVVIHDPQPPPRLDDYKNIVGAADIDELKFLAQALKGKTVRAQLYGTSGTANRKRSACKREPAG